MKRLGFFLISIILFSSCGGGGRGGDDEIRVALEILLGDPQGGGVVTGETIRVEGPGISFTCTQSPTQTNTNDPDQCEVPSQGQGNQSIPLTFKSLPAENDTYTFTDGNDTAPRSGECVVTVVNSSTLESPGNTVSSDNSSVVCDQIGAGSPNPLRLTITFS
ncbi:MAG: hypothetical protein LLH30_08750 [Candidatus Manganitrophus sp. SA1]|nr:hypothetical protein [Candidatus Manganitrophus morganii]